MAEHQGVPYLTALKAVDEPLHQLRDFVSETGKYSGLWPHFRLVGEKSIYSSPLRSDELSFNPERMIRTVDPRDPELRDSEFSSFGRVINDSYYKEMGRRVSLLEESGSPDVWHYRELYRAGLLGESAQEIEPFFHHFRNDGWAMGQAIAMDGARLGVFCVSFYPFSKVGETARGFLPVTRTQLAALRSGEPAGKLSLPLYQPRGNGTLEWSTEVALTARLKESYSNSGERLTVLFREVPEDLSAVMNERGLRMSLFNFEYHYEELERYNFSLRGSDLIVNRPGRSVSRGLSYRILEIDGERSDLEVAPQSSSATSPLSPPISLISRVSNLDHAIQLIQGVSTLDRTDNSALRSVVASNIERHGGVATLAQIAGELRASTDIVCRKIGLEIHQKFSSATT